MMHGVCYELRKLSINMTKEVISIMPECSNLKLSQFKLLKASLGTSQSS